MGGDKGREQMIELVKTHQETLDFVANLVEESNHWLHRESVEKHGECWYRVMPLRDMKAAVVFDNTISIDADRFRFESRRVQNPDPNEFYYVPISRKEALRLKLAQRKCRICMSKT